MDQYNQDYRIKYQHNKDMYIRLSAQQKGGSYMDNEVDYFFVHHVIFEENIHDILKDGEIKLVKDVPVDKRARSGPDDLEYVYANIQFNDIDNLMGLGNHSLLIHPQIAYDQDWIFNSHWSKYPVSDSIFVYESDSPVMRDNKLKKIKEYVKDPTFYKGTPFGEKTDLKKLGVMGHEVLFTEPISLSKYLIGIVYYGEPSKMKGIEKLLEKYPNAKIIKYDEKIKSKIITPSARAS